MSNMNKPEVFTGALSDIPPDFMPVGTTSETPDTTEKDTTVKIYFQYKGFGLLRQGDGITRDSFAPKELSTWTELDEFLRHRCDSSWCVWEVEHRYVRNGEEIGRSTLYCNIQRDGVNGYIFTPVAKPSSINDCKLVIVETLE